jgi:hypothetical protein
MAPQPTGKLGTSQTPERRQVYLCILPSSPLHRLCLFGFPRLEPGHDHFGSFSFNGDPVFSLAAANVTPV